MEGEVGYYYRAGAHFWIELPCPGSNKEVLHENT